MCTILSLPFQTFGQRVIILHERVNPWCGEVEAHDALETVGSTRAGYVRLIYSLGHCYRIIPVTDDAIVRFMR